MMGGLSLTHRRGRRTVYALRPYNLTGLANKDSVVLSDYRTRLPVEPEAKPSNAPGALASGVLACGTALVAVNFTHLRGCLPI